MGFYGSYCHLELSGDFGIVITLQKQFNNLLFARTEPDGLLLHLITSFCSVRRSDVRLTLSRTKFLFFLYTKRAIDYPKVDSGRQRSTFAMSHYTGDLASADSNEQVSIE